MKQIFTAESNYQAFNITHGADQEIIEVASGSINVRTFA